MEAIGIKENAETRLGVNWVWLYGELTPGHYRIGKHVSAIEAPENYTESEIYAEFTIQ